MLQKSEDTLENGHAQENEDASKWTCSVKNEDASENGDPREGHEFTRATNALKMCCASAPEVRRRSALTRRTTALHLVSKARNTSPSYGQTSGEGNLLQCRRAAHFLLSFLRRRDLHLHRGLLIRLGHIDRYRIKTAVRAEHLHAAALLRS